MSDLALTKIDGAKQLLDQAKTVEDVKAVADMAEAARVYARRAKASIQVINRAVAIKLMAERKAGEMLAGMEKVSGRPKASQHARLLSDVGVSYTQSSRWQQAAKVPEHQFKAYVLRCDNDGKEFLEDWNSRLNEPSGLRATTASIWVYYIPGRNLLLRFNPKKMLDWLFDKEPAPKYLTRVGDSNADGYVVPIDEITAQSFVSKEEVRL
jgi:hypothetical protein